MSSTIPRNEAVSRWYPCRRYDPGPTQEEVWGDSVESRQSFYRSAELSVELRLAGGDEREPGRSGCFGVADDVAGFAQ